MPGYRADVQRLCSIFWLVGYDLRVFVDLTAQEMRDVAGIVANEKENNDSIFKGYASLFVCILAHGISGGEVYGVDGQTVRIDQLQKPFVDVDYLKNKPKLFIVQACRGDQADLRTNSSPPPQAYVDDNQNPGK